MKELTGTEIAIYKAIGAIFGILLFCWIYGCTKPKPTPSTPSYKTILVKVNHIDAGEKLYIYYTQEDSTLTNWTSNVSGHGSLRAKIHKIGLSADIIPTSDSIWIYVDGTLEATGYQNNFLDISISY